MEPLHTLAYTVRLERYGSDESKELHQLVFPPFSQNGRIVCFKTCVRARAHFENK